MPLGASVDHEAAAGDPGGLSLFNNIVAGSGSSLFKIVIQLVMLPVMGRLLGPADFGLYATALPLISFFSVIADGGLGMSLARESPTNVIVWSTAQYAALLLAILLVVVINGCGISLALITHEPRVSLLMSVLSLSFVFIGISVVPAARLTSRNDLVTGAILDVAAAVVGAVTAVAAALRGFGAFSLAFQFVVAYGIRAVGLNIVAFQAPKLQFSLSSLRSHVSTGGVLVGGRLLDLLCRFLENLFFSLIFGPGALGAYTFANQISRFLSEAASNPTWSALYSQAIRERRENLPALLVRLTRLIIMATGPLAAVLAAGAPQLLDQVLGSKWQAAAPMLAVLSPSFVVASAASLAGAIFLAINRNGAFLKTFAFLSVGRVLAVALGHWVGMMGVVYLLAIVHVAYALIVYSASRNIFVLSLRDMFAETIGPLVAALVAFSACFLTVTVAPAALLFTGLAIAAGGLAFVVDLLVIESERLRSDIRSLVAKLPRRQQRSRLPVRSGPTLGDVLLRSEHKILAVELNRIVQEFN